MAKGKKPDSVTVGPVLSVVTEGEMSLMLMEIRERFRKLVRGTYFPQRLVIEFLAYLDAKKPKAKADDATTKPIAKPEPATTAGAPSGPGHVGRDSASDAG